MDDKQLGDMVVRLFESKCKHYTKITIKVWVDELKQLEHAVLPVAMKRMILSGDDFPSIGKVMETIKEIYREKSKVLFLDLTEGRKKLDTCPEKIKIFFTKRYSLEKHLAGQLGHTDKTVNKFINLCLDMKQTGIANEDIKRIEF